MEINRSTTEGTTMMIAILELLLYWESSALAKLFSTIEYSIVSLTFFSFTVTIGMV
jgi:hypothetical protein